MYSRSRLQYARHDCKAAQALRPTDDILGGVIEEIGPKVTKEWQKGDRVCGFVHGGNETQPESGMT